jgi:hypothetical protein
MRAAKDADSSALDYVLPRTFPDIVEYLISEEFGYFNNAKERIVRALVPPLS